MADIEPVAAPGARAPAFLGASSLSLSAVYRLLAQLQHVLRFRLVDRAGADRLLRLAEHNLGEATRLMTEARSPSGRQAVDLWLGTVTDVRQGVTDLRPRVLRLFDDAEQTAPREPVPRIPW
jgi:hypothetical protein